MAFAAAGGRGGGAGAAAAADGAGIDPEEVSLLRATVDELRAMLEAERVQARTNVDLLDYAKQLLHKNHIQFQPEKRLKGHSSEGEEALDLRALRRPSLIKDVGIDKHFAALAKALTEEHRATSRTTVRIKNLSYELTLSEASKPFPTIGDVLLSCITTPYTALARRTTSTSSSGQPNKQQPTRTLKALDRVTALLEPGKLYLVLGGPKEGKTSFLKAVAGRLPARGHKGVLTGEVTYNGEVRSGRFDPGSIASYVEQLDNNEAMLTVRETLEFAGACLVPHPSPEALSSAPFYRMLVEALDIDDVTKKDLLEGKAHTSSIKVRLALARHRARAVMNLLGLTRCADTVVGNEKIRGVSGGERRRVTLAEMLMGNFSVLALDEISTGLDSAATLDIVFCIRSIAQAFGYTAAISLLQPPPEVYALFDEVMMVHSGRLVYQGPASTAPNHFASLGFRYQPSCTDAADFLLKVTSREAVKLLMSRAEMEELGIRNGGLSAPPPSAFVGPSAADEMVKAYEGTEVWKEKQSAIEAPTTVPHAWRAYERKKFRNSWATSFALCFRRELLFVLRDRVFVTARVTQNLFLGIVHGTIYWQIPLASYNTRFGVLFQCLMAVAMKTAALIPEYFSHRRIFYKQKAAGFFHPSAYSLAATVVGSPFALLDAVLYGSIVYWCAGLSSSAYGLHFFLFLLLLVSTGLAMMQLFRLLSFLLPSTTAAQASNGLLIFFLLLFSGFITAKESVPSYWIWLLYSNPLYYAFQALTVNEMRSSAYSTPIPSLGITLGESFLRNKGLATETYWLWLGLGMTFALGAAYFVATLILVQVVEHPEVVSGRKEEVGKEGEEEDEKDMKDEVLQVLIVDDSGQGGVGGRKGGSMLAQPLSSSSDEDRRAIVELTGLHKRAHQGNDDGTMMATLPPLPSPTAPPKRQFTASSLPFTPLTLVFKDVRYSVSIRGSSSSGGGGGEERVDLLKDVSGYLKPGTLTALMGSSGAGKTTLLDVLAGRKSSGQVRGDIRVNGFPVKRSTYRRLIGYVEQMDIHSPYTTVAEALRFSAGLRLAPSVTEEQREAFMQEVMTLLELSPIRDEIIGMGGSGLSTEQRKRVSIGVEIVANPSLLFLDEPTSGLDARAAMLVVTTLQRLAKQGRTLVCTIHQPSTQLFRAFDNLLLLRRGGRTVFFGPLGFQSVNLITYLESIPGTPRIEAGENPATWMLGCIGAGTSGTEKWDYAAEYARSTLCRQNGEEIDRLVDPLPGQEPLAPPHQASWMTAFLACTHRALRSYYRQPAYNFVRITLCMVVALILASVYVGQTQETAADLIGFIGVIYLSSMFIGAINVGAIVQVVHNERSAFYRERFLKLYPVSAYALSWLVAEIPYVFILVGTFVNVFYWACGYSRDVDRFFMYWLFLWELVTFYTYFGQFIAAASPTVQTAQLITSTLNPLFSTFSGFTIIPGDIPRFYLFAYFCTPLHWVLEGMVVTQWHGDDGPITFFSPQAMKEVTVTRWQFIDGFFKGWFRWEHRWINVGVLACFILAARVGFFLCLSKLKYEVR